MFRAFGRFLRTLGHKISGIFGRKTEKLMRDADTIKGAYSDVIKEKTNRINQYMSAVGEMIAQNQRRVSRIEKLSSEVERLERVKAGALAKAKSMMEQGKTAEDAEVVKLKAAYADASSTLDEKKESIAELEQEIENTKDGINSHRVQLQTMQREIAKLKTESSEAVADVKAAEAEQSIANTIAGISDDTTDETLEMLRNARDNAKGKAEVARQVAGTDAMALEAELEAFGASSAGADEFDALLGSNDAAEVSVSDGDVPVDAGNKS